MQNNPDDFPLPERLNPDELDRYLAGESSTDEAERVRRFLESHPEHSRRVDALLEPGPTAATPDPAHGWELVRSRLREAGKLPDLPPISPRWEHRRKIKIPTRRSPRLWWTVPLAVAAIGLFWLRPHGTSGSGSKAAEAMHVLSTANGERATIDLADGTRVTLGPASKLRVPESFGNTRRDVYLDGHAKFDVHHAPTPFVVHALDVEVRDLGTVFAVRGYGHEPLQVGVAEGSVELQTPDSAQGAPLTPGDVATIDSAGRTTVEHNVPVDRFLAWTNGHVEFHDESLRQVTEELRQWFPIGIVVGDSVLLSRRITTAFRGSSQLRETIAAMAAALGADAKWRGDTVTLTRSTR